MDGRMDGRGDGRHEGRGGGLGVGKAEHVEDLERFVIREAVPGLAGCQLERTAEGGDAESNRVVGHVVVEEKEKSVGSPLPG